MDSWPEKKGENCLITTPEKKITVANINLDAFSNVFAHRLFEMPDDSLSLIAEVGKKGAYNTKLTYKINQITCTAELTYKFKLASENIKPASFTDIKNDGLSYQKLNGKTVTIYTENGKTYTKKDENKSIFFHPMLTEYTPAIGTDSKCMTSNIFILHKLEKMGAVEYLPTQENL